ncbi:signal peptidase I [Methanococcoides burtonii]|uniref:Peptidase S24-like protein n=1 Tax=Methanococcoides burtonii (strain DSM 6242 / NBRC 107633 / OCM 468 / ACE-M) TaxID=259564 RepID=Q12VA0_METBU|nr:signal peptidase I [Methanococcoides burtonii]ABE52626.1 Peptidase S24-like protein [Methanococcoides burtonii DSM 6242]
MTLQESFHTFRTSENFWISLTRDLVSVLLAVMAFAVISQIVFGMWTPMVAVESGSMEPHMQIGDIIFIKSIDRAQIITNNDTSTEHIKFKMQGDVILYRPHGQEGVTPIIHRAMYYVEEGETMWFNGPVAPHSGYVTKGDNIRTNIYFDQQGQISQYEPIKEEWIIGTAQFRIPYVGYLRLLIS